MKKELFYNLFIIFPLSLLAGFIRCAESIPVLIGVPLTAFLNDSSHRFGRAGYFICSASTAISAILMFFVGYPTVCNHFNNNSSKFNVPPFENAFKSHFVKQWSIWKFVWFIFFVVAGWSTKSIKIFSQWFNHITLHDAIRLSRFTKS